LQLSRSNWKNSATSIALALLFIILSSLAQNSQTLGGQRSSEGEYFLVVWAFQGPDDDLVHSHTFASFYRGDDLAKGVVEPATISWLPVSGTVRPFSVEPGRNFSLDETVGMACHAGRKVSSWGPYKIRPELYHSAMKRIQLLQSGRIRYSMMNASPHSMNCIAAAGNLTSTPLDTGILWGVAASAAVVKHLSPYFLSDASIPQILVDAVTAKACSGNVGEAAEAPEPLAPLN
jgi:hypothetical protein